MSGIYGIYRYDGAPVDPQWLERMRNAMAYYGPDGGSCKIDGPVGMGHLLLEVNPEDAFERQPMPSRRGLVVTSVRLDNREALLDAFGIPSSQAPKVSDGHLVSLAFDRWGEDVCTHLEGDWALAAWDAKQRRLLLARDVFGMAALYYHQGKGFIAFASSLKALLALPGVVKEPDFLRLAEVLVSWQHDAELTAYKGFRSLVGAQALTFFPDGRMCDARFWSPEGRELLRLRRDDDYVEAFLEHYTRAVKNCLRSEKPIGAELSGGRDSGSVVTLAAPILGGQNRELTAYTSVPWLQPDGADKSRSGNEWELAHATATMAGSNVRHVPVDAKDCSVLDGINRILDIHDGPGHAPSNGYWIQAVMDYCSRSRTAVVLTGQLGNATVSWAGNGSALLALFQRQPAAAFRLFLQAEPNPWLTLKRQILKPILKPGMIAIRRSVISPRRYWRAYSALSTQMAEELDLDGRMRAAGYDPTFTYFLQDVRGSFFLRPKYGTFASITSEIGTWYSLSRRDPTSNLSMLEFLLRVPDNYFYRRGQHSHLIRCAFQGRMPDAVLAQGRMGLQAADLGHRIVRERVAFQDCLRLLGTVPEAREVLDLPLIDRCLRELVAEVNSRTTATAVDVLARGLGVGLFLHRLAEHNSPSPRPGRPPHWTANLGISLQDKI